MQSLVPTHRDPAWWAARIQRALRLRPPMLLPELRSSLLLECPPPGHPIKVLACSHNLRHEGAPISLKELALGLREAGLDVEVAWAEDGPLRASYEQAGVRLHPMPFRVDRLSTPRRLQQTVDAWERLVRTSSADIVLANTLQSFPAVLAAEKAGRPSVWVVRESEPWNTYFDFLPVTVAREAVRAYGLPAHAVFVAESTRANWQVFEPHRPSQVLHNALDLRRFEDWRQADRQGLRKMQGWAEHDVVLLAPGTVCERKGQIDAIRALEILCRERAGQKLRLVLVGNAEPRYRERVAHIIQGNPRLQAQVELRGTEDDIGQLYRAADVFVSCSRLESYPRVILEALAFGLPVVTTPVFGVREQLPDPGDALLYEPGDIAALSAHLRAVSDLEKRSRLALRSRQAFARLDDFETMRDRYATLLTKSAGRRAPGGVVR